MVGSDKIKQKVAQIYDTIHEKLEPNREKSMTNLTHLLLRDIDIPENPRSLDIGCGTGYSSFELDKQCNQKGTIYGIDISHKSLDLARQTAENRGCSNISFEIGDAENLKFHDSYFDLVISNMAFQFIPDKRKALSEVYRVLRPGGVFAFLFPGKMQYQESREILMKVAERYEKNPEALLGVREVDNLLIDLVESELLFRSVGFSGSFIYGFHRVRFVEPDWFIGSLSGTWGFWKVGLSQSLIDAIHFDLIAESKKAVSHTGFKLTNYLIHATGTKPVNR
jgi:ubiquinone/menaquinone biosynthesis C-methylase UbiE